MATQVVHPLPLGIFRLVKEIPGVLDIVVPTNVPGVTKAEVYDVSLLNYDLHRQYQTATSFLDPASQPNVAAKLLTLKQQYPDLDIPTFANDVYKQIAVGEAQRNYAQKPVKLFGFLPFRMERSAEFSLRGMILSIISIFGIGAAAGGLSAGASGGAEAAGGAASGVGATSIPVAPQLTNAYSLSAAQMGFAPLAEPSGYAVTLAGATPGPLLSEAPLAALGVSTPQLLASSGGMLSNLSNLIGYASENPTATASAALSGGSFIDKLVRGDVVGALNQGLGFFGLPGAIPQGSQLPGITSGPSASPSSGGGSAGGGGGVSPAYAVADALGIRVSDYVIGAILLAAVGIYVWKKKG